MRHSVSQEQSHRAFESEELHLSPTMSSHASLDAAAQERKAKLAKLRSLKRKQPDTQDDDTSSEQPVRKASKSPAPEVEENSEDISSRILSGRNYDPATKGPKLGFEAAPSEGQDTVELRARALADEVKRKQDEEAKEDKPLDLFKLQPKKPNWDLKRDLQKRYEVLNVRTENAIARLVRDRIEKQKQAAAEKKGLNGATGSANGDGGEGDEKDMAGLGGVDLVEAIRVREMEDEEDERREREVEAMDDGT